jgi:sirohydrochlorin ferrochelatase
MTTSAQTALVIIAHGSREPDANADAVYLAQAIENRGAYAIVEAAFLELAEPTIDKAVETCVRRGARKVVLVPYFLSAGVHVRRDLAELTRRLSIDHPETAFRLAEPLGRHPGLVDIVIERASGVAEND